MYSVIGIEQRYIEYSGRLNEISLLRVNFRVGANDMACVSDWLTFSLTKIEPIVSEHSV